jgi:hypothetical protein
VCLSTALVGSPHPRLLPWYPALFLSLLTFPFFPPLSLAQDKSKWVVARSLEEAKEKARYFPFLPTCSYFPSALLTTLTYVPSERSSGQMAISSKTKMCWTLGLGEPYLPPSLAL